MRETSTATLLFCDLVGSTELFSRVGDDAADALRRTIFDALRAALDECGGIEVKHLGDGLMAVFTASATDAIASAVSMQRRISEMDASSTVGPIELRVGLSTGEVAPEDGDWFGRPVIEAARLCAAAAPRVILTSDVVRSVAGTRGGYQFTSAGLLNLKGLGAPVGAWAVEWHADGAAASGRLVVPAARHRTVFQRRWTVALVPAAAALLLLGWLVVQPQSPDSTTSQTVQGPSGYTPRLQNVACEASLTSAEPRARCALLVVPEDRSRPGGRQLKMLVRRVPATSQTTTGEATISIGLEAPADELVNSSVRTRGEHITLVTRGAPGTQPAMECPDVNRQVARDLAFAPTDPQRLVAREKVTRACHDQLLRDGFDLNAYGSRDAALDIRDLAFVLGLRKVNLQAGLTDTRTAQEVAVEAPGLLRSLVLQDVQPPEANALDGEIATATGALERYVAECESSAACRATTPDLDTSVRRLYDEFSAHPIEVQVPNPAEPTTSLTVLIDGDRAVKTLVDGLGDPLALPLVAATTASADPELIASYAAVRNSPPDDFPNAARIARYCIDEAPLGNSLLLEASMKATPMFRSLGLEPASDVCDSWSLSATRQSTNPTPPSTGGVPTLILAPDLNPYTSPKWADDTARSFGGASVIHLPHLTVDPLGHGPPCVGQIRTRFMAHPDRPIDASACIRTIQPLQFS